MLKTSHVAVGAALVFVGYVLFILAGRATGTPFRVIVDLVPIALTITAAVFCAVATRTMQGRMRLAWLSMTVGLLGWGLGQVIWTHYELQLPEVPFPSIADAGYLALPVGGCLALLLFPVEGTQSRGRLVLDGIIVALSLFLVSWVIILRPLYLADTPNRLGFAISLAYPIFDITILTVAAVVLVRASDDHRLSLTLLTAGVVCFAFSDSGFAYLAVGNRYRSGNMIDIGWAAGLLLITVAATAGHEGTERQRDAFVLPGWTSVWLPYAPLLVAGFVTAAQPVPVLKTRPVIIAAGILAVAVLARQFLAVREDRRLVATVADQARHDPLTGLANRALFNERLTYAMQLREREGLQLAVVSVDLNDFKLVNDTLGHLVGDDLLIGVGRRLRNCVRGSGTVARLGGDEFSLLVDGGAEAAERVGARIVEAFEEPFQLSGHELLMRPSIGLAVADSNEPHLAAEELLRRADTAMYSAKRSRFRGVQVYNPDMHLLDEAADVQVFGAPAAISDGGGVGTVLLLGKLRQAVDRAELTLAYQPKFDLRTAEMVGVEGLLRWPQPGGDALAPEEFLPLIRRHGLMGPVTQLVITRALDDALVWHRAGVDVPVAVNVFAPSMANAGLPAIIAKELSDRGLRSAALAVEITEDLFLDSSERTRAVLEQLRQNGIRIAIDDFGSGYSALSYLRDLPIDEVKLDRSFVAPILADARAAAVVRAVVDLAHVLDLTVVVEGVEDAATAALVRELGCDIGQGFFYGPPVSPEEVLRLVQRRADGAAT
ncbi:putative bifunctional diguanylate cyclase/phosphodiesterase [Mycolicibacterium helvum]|uniref:GGDEF-domain containing protein n=1 Tax=Mycolicibacterium helvum TaxID=1534349 RepID=A0A7I7TAS1_9MYCO|nr:EAL domain-containing protein [Mycolicibacterium helvum]BBY66352.1 GGDEF-domain containing protein [Mycolicibacterium helvum]